MAFDPMAMARVERERERMIPHQAAFRNALVNDDFDLLETPVVLSWLMDEGFVEHFNFTPEVLSKFLASGKCDVDTPTPMKSFAEHSIAMSCNATPQGVNARKCLEVLLDHHPKIVNRRSGSTETALHFIAMYSDVATAQLLLDRGADPTLQLYNEEDCVSLVQKGTRLGMNSGSPQLTALLTKAKKDFVSKCHLPGCDQRGSNRCSKCQRARYCSADHQAAHLNSLHKNLCATYKVINNEPRLPKFDACTIM
eukprot:m.92916 g.92916  ORF g.92916 m.92916 type:complete len:253 (-) comp26582_c0_seq2:306-1064(-)